MMLEEQVPQVLPEVKTSAVQGSPSSQSAALVGQLHACAMGTAEPSEHVFVVGEVLLAPESSWPASPSPMITTPPPPPPLPVGRQPDTSGNTVNIVKRKCRVLGFEYSLLKGNSPSFCYMQYVDVSIPNGSMVTQPIPKAQSPASTHDLRQSGTGVPRGMGVMKSTQVVPSRQVIDGMVQSRGEQIPPGLKASNGLPFRSVV